MTILTAAAVLALASTCQHTVDPRLVLKQAIKESSLDTAAVNINRDGSRDIGLMQINERNFDWLGLTARSALDPCLSIAAGVAVLTSLSRYNSGSPVKSLAYAMAVQAVRIDPAPLARPPPPDSPAPIFARPSPSRELVFSQQAER